MGEWRYAVNNGGALPKLKMFHAAILQQFVSPDHQASILEK
ncbi:hypothetical protein [Acinetobacter sp. UBA2063]|nr:hypothetical protein [Acinetobacter sp. UBA2063]